MVALSKKPLIQRHYHGHCFGMVVASSLLEEPQSTTLEIEGALFVIHVKENILDADTVTMDVSGVLDQGAVPILKVVCERHLRAGKRVVLNLEAIVHITRDGRGFIEEIQNAVRVANLPEFMKPEHKP